MASYLSDSRARVDSEAKRQTTSHAALESVTRAFETLKLLIVDYDGLTNEKNDLERQVGRLNNERDSLREEIKRLDEERQRYASTLSTFASQIDAMGSRSVELAKSVMAHAKAPESGESSERRSASQFRLAEKLDLDTPKFLKNSRDEAERSRDDSTSRPRGES